MVYKKMPTSNLKFSKKIALIMLSAAIALYGCSSTEEANMPNEIISSEVVYSESASSRNVDSQISNGVHVIGIGKLEIEPELAIVNVGVEVFSLSVATASKKATNSLNKMLESLKSDGITSDQIVTKNYDIQPTYEWEDIYKNGIRSNQRVLTGYVVRNDVEVTILEMGIVGRVIDNLTVAGGDDLRIDNITFGVESLINAEREAMLLASKDAIDKANAIAKEMGFSIGRVLYVSESSNVPRETNIAYDTRSFAMSEAPTPIYGSDLTVTAQIYAIFGID